MGVYLSQGSVLGSAPVKQREGKTRTDPRRKADRDNKTAPENRTTDTGQRRPHRGQQESASKSKAFRVLFLARFSGRRPCFTHLPCPVWTLTLGSPLWRSRLCAGAPRHQSTSGRFARVLQLFEIVDELVGTVVARALTDGEGAAGETTGLPSSVIDHAGCEGRLAVAWIPWPEVVLIRSWLDKNLTSISQTLEGEAGRSRMRETRICANRTCRRRACHRRACRRKKKKIERYFFVLKLTVLGLVPCARGLAGAFVWGIGDPFGMN